jgi:hypothetical protein
VQFYALLTIARNAGSTACVFTSNEGDCHEQWGEWLVAIGKNKRNKEPEQRVLGKNSRPRKRKKEKRRLLLLRAL